MIGDRPIGSLLRSSPDGPGKRDGYDLLVISQCILFLSAFSVSQLTDHDCTVSFYASSCSVQNRHTSALIGHGCKRGGLNYMDCLHLPSSATGFACVGVSSSSSLDNL